MDIPGLKEFIASSLAGEAYSGNFEVEPVRQEASTRVYHRVLFPRSGSSLILCSGLDAESETWRDFLAVTRQLAGNAVPVPTILGMDNAHGWMLLSDAGRSDLAGVLHPPLPVSEASTKSIADQAIRTRLLGQCLDVLSAIHRTPVLPPVSTRAFDMQKLQWEIDFMLTHLQRVCRKFGIENPASFEFQMFLYELCDMLGHREDLVFTHRDFHSRNILMPGPDGPFTIVDYQDARLGLPWYDLSSLLFDPYALWSRDERRWAFDTYCAKMGLTGNGRWGMFLAQALQRVLKALGTYLFVTFERGRASHAPFIETAIDRAEEIIQQARMPDCAFLFVSLFRKGVQPRITDFSP